MSAMRIRHPARRDRLLLRSALSVALLTLLGAAGERLGYDRWLKANTVKTCSHSLFRQGLMLYQHIPHCPSIGCARRARSLKSHVNQCIL